MVPTATHYSHPRVADLVRSLPPDVPSSAREEGLRELIALHQTVSTEGEEAKEIRQAFLALVAGEPELLEEEDFAQFVADNLQPGDFMHIIWESPGDVVAFCDSLYRFPFRDEARAREVRNQVNRLLRDALYQFERQGEMEKMLRLLQVAPTEPLVRDGELLRLRNRAYVYEQRRVTRNRRILYLYLLLVAFLIVVVFPLLFVNAENGLIVDQIEDAANVDIPEQGRQTLNYYDGLYWSLITAASIGYGDITPQTTMGRALAALLGLLGVISIGVIAGLILNLITPRQID